MNTNALHIPSNKVRDIEQYILNELSPLYPEREIRQFTRMLFESYLGWSTTDFLLNRTGTVNQSDLLKFHWAVEDLRHYRPIQHIIGYTDFCDCRIAVNENVLIPRPETEEIVQQITSISHPSTILDLCTGSGCIAIALAKQFPDARVFGIDVSVKALDTAIQNAKSNAVDVQFEQCDLLHQNLQLPEETFDLIISNPPYICQRERVQMQPNVLNYEPSLALFVEDDDPLIFYRHIGNYASRHLSEKGILAFEINETLGQDTCSMLQSQGFSTELRKDFRGKDRMVIASR